MPACHDLSRELPDGGADRGPDARADGPVPHGDRGPDSPVVQADARPDGPAADLSPRADLGAADLPRPDTTRPDALRSDQAVTSPDQALPLPDQGPPPPDGAVILPDQALPLPDRAVPLPDRGAPDQAVLLPDLPVIAADQRATDLSIGCPGVTNGDVIQAYISLGTGYVLGGYEFVYTELVIGGAHLDVKCAATGETKLSGIPVMTGYPDTVYDIPSDGKRLLFTLVSRTSSRVLLNITITDLNPADAGVAADLRAVADAPAPPPDRGGPDLLPGDLSGPDAGALTVVGGSTFAVSLARYDSYAPAVAAMGTGFLVVWQNNYNIYGTRVDASGNVLDSGEISICTETNYQQAPAVACGATLCLVVWMDTRSGATTDIYGAYVDSAGAVTPYGGFKVSSTGAASYGYPAVAFDGTDFLVVWANGPMTSTDIYGVRVDTSGTILDSTPRAISLAADRQIFPDIAFDGTRFLVVWQDNRTGTYAGWKVYGARVDRSGYVSEPSGLLIHESANDATNPRVASGGGRFLVVWDQDDGASRDIHGARVSSAGTVLDTTLLQISAATQTQQAPAVAGNGSSGFLTIWQDYRGTTQAYAARVNNAGTVLDPAGVAIPSLRGSEPAVAYGSGQFLTVWVQDVSTSTKIYGARITF